MIEEHVFDEIVHAFSKLLSHAVRESTAIILDNIKGICMAYDEDFRHLVQAHEDVTSDFLERNVDFALADPTYNARN